MGDDTEVFKKAWWKSVNLWLYGAASAFIGGGATAGVVLIDDPKKYNFNEGLVSLFRVFVISGIVSLFFYLKQSPMPKLPESAKIQVNLAFILAILSIAFTCGCASQNAYEKVTTPDGTITQRRLLHIAVLNKSALSNLAFGKKTKTTESLLSYDSANTETQTEIMAKLVEGAVAGAVKGVK